MMKIKKIKYTDKKHDKVHCIQCEGDSFSKRRCGPEGSARRTERVRTLFSGGDIAGEV